MFGSIRPRVVKPSSRGGFTLVEVMVGLVMVLVGLLGMAALTATLAHANRGATNRTRADHILHEKAEEFRSVPYDSISTGEDFVTIEGVEFTRSWTVTENVPTEGVKEVQLTAVWSEGGQDLQMSTATYIGEQ